jgi:hypothetical protein
MNSEIEEEYKRRNMPICFSPEQLGLLKEFAKKKGMTSYSQAVEFVAIQNNHQ